VHEIKADGYRSQLQIWHGAVTAFTRRGNNWASKLSAIVAAAKALEVKEAVLDGEIIVPDPDTGLSDFNELQKALGGHPERIHFYAFDLMYLDGYDLRDAVLIDRKAALRRILDGHIPGRFLYSEHLEMNGSDMYRRACEMGIEGTVSKLRDSRYVSGPNETWVKTICRQRETFVVVGFEPGKHGMLRGAYLGRHEGDRLLYAGKVEVGFTGDAARALRARLEPLATNKSPLTVDVKKPKAVWVKPGVLIDVEYRGITSAGQKLRHASFKGVREDLMEPLRRARRARRGTSR
jgi:bifunctional non-homologous end joining protein LigD